MADMTGFDPHFFPGSWSLNPDAAAGSPSAKSRPLSELYPEIDRYRIVAADRYTSPEFMRREWQGIWTKSWSCAGRVSDLPVPGSWFKYDLGGESFIVTRAFQISSAGEIRRGRRIETWPNPSTTPCVTRIRLAAARSASASAGTGPPETGTGGDDSLK